MNTRKLHISLAVSFGLLAAVGVLTLMGVLVGRPSVVQAQGGNTRYVALTGTDSSNDCTNSSSPCHTVQYAVDQANDGDEIRVAIGTYTGVSAREGVTQVVYISKTVAIRGGFTTTDWTTPNPDTNPTTLDAQDQGRVLYITGGISPTVEGLRITDGNATGLGSDPEGWDDVGGGVYVISATVVISNNQIFSNTAVLGGGLYLKRSDGTLSNNTVATNIAWDGGGLYLEYGDATLNENTIVSNTVSGPMGAGQGGGLWMSYSNATLNGNTVMSNTANGLGGGLFLYGGNPTLNGNSVAANTAGAGGGLALYSRYATLNNNTFISNTAGGGGGLYVNMSVATFDGNIIQNNTAERGGGLFLYMSDTVLTNTVVIDNRVNDVGSGIYIWRPNTPRFLHTTIARNTGGDGSGVYATGGSTAIFTDTILVSHTLGITATAGSVLTLNATLWYGNGTDRGGAGTINHTNDRTGDPKFDADGYHLTSNSAAIDEGVNAGVSTDVDGDPRPIGTGYDIGADEFSQQWYIYLPAVVKNHP